MVKINGQEIEWKKFPKGWYLTDVKYHVLWRSEETGAMFLLIKIPVGSVQELPHTHPHADQMGFPFTGEAIGDDGNLIVLGDGYYRFAYRPKGTSHGPSKGSKMRITKEIISLQYYDGPPTRINEGKTIELTLD